MKNSGKVEICGVNTSKLKTLTDNEKKELLIKFEKIENITREEVIKALSNVTLDTVYFLKGKEE